MPKAIAIFGITSSIAAGVFWGPMVFGIAAVLTLTALAMLVYRQIALVRVGELEVAVVMADGQKRFSRFLPAGAHFINPLTERVTDTISTAGRSVRGKTEKIQTVGGLPVAVSWSVKFSLDPRRIKRDKAPKIARSLPTKAATLVNDHMHHILHHVLEEYSIEGLCRAGIHDELERTVRQQLMARLHDLGFKISRIMIESIEKPAHVIQALEAAHERQIQAELEAEMLSRLQRVISRFSDEDMRRLVELERIHVMGRHGVAMVVPPAGEPYGLGSRPRQPVILDPFSN